MVSASIRFRALVATSAPANGLASAIGTALAKPDRLPDAALGDGGFLMGISELETVVRLKLPLVIVMYNDSAYGAEVHHFTDPEMDRSIVTFPETDLAAIARGYGAEGVAVRTSEDFNAVRNWVDGSRDRPLVIDGPFDHAHLDCRVGRTTRGRRERSGGSRNRRM